MDTLQSYSPIYNDQPVITVPCHGDGLSVERMIDAKRARAAGVNPLAGRCGTSAAGVSQKRIATSGNVHNNDEL
jgi:hypothetical protein